MKCIDCIAALTFSQVALAAEEAALVLDPSVQEKLAPLLRNYKPSKPIASSVEIREINNKGNFGTLTYYERQAVYARQESGLWAVLSTGRFTASGSAGSAQSVSLCGLVTLLSATAGKMVFDNSGVVPIGKHFVPFGIKSSVDTGRRLRVTAVEFDTPNICAPAPGAEFKYRIETEVQTKTSGLL